jgi:hypothetical protein
MNLELGLRYSKGPEISDQTNLPLTCSFLIKRTPVKVIGEWAELLIDKIHLSGVELLFARWWGGSFLGGRPSNLQSSSPVRDDLPKPNLIASVTSSKRHSDSSSNFKTQNIDRLLV